MKSIKNKSIWYEGQCKMFSDLACVTLKGVPSLWKINYDIRRAVILKVSRDVLLNIDIKISQVTTR